MKTQILAFWNAHKVFIVGLLTFVGTSIAELTQASPVDWYLILYTAILAGGSYLGKNLRGQYASIAGIVIPIVINVLDGIHSHTPVSFVQLLGTAFVQYMAFLQSPAKPREYESAPIIVQAKEEAKEIKQEEVSSVPTV